MRCPPAERRYTRSPTRSAFPGALLRWAALRAGVAAALAAAPALGAEPGALVPAVRDQGVLAAELGADGLWLKVCAQVPCAARQGVRSELPPDVVARRAQAKLEVVELEEQRRVLHARVQLEEGAWEALLAARPGRLEPLVIFSGLTGLTRGVDGERSGASIQIVARSRGRRILLGELREDVNLCGRTALLAPRLLTPAAFELEPASVQRLGGAEREHAPELVAARAAAPTAPNPLRARFASSALVSPNALTDGDPNTRWSEGRAGDGRGEFVILHNTADRPLVGFDFLVRAPGANEHARGPRALWLATREQLFEVRWQEDAASAAGVWYTVTLPTPLATDCVSLVLESAFMPAPDAQVGFAELSARVARLTLEPALAASRLGVPGADGDAALAALVSAGSAGVGATLAALPALDAAGRARALEVLERAPCAEVAPAYVSYLGTTAPQAERAERRLKQCGEVAAPALAQAFAEATSDQRRGLAPLLAALAPKQSVTLLTSALAGASGPDRDAYRDALSSVSRRPSAQPELTRLLADETLPPRLTLELLRVLGDDVVRYEPGASQALERVTRALPDFADRYLSLAPAGRLSGRAPGARAWLVLALRDANPHLRAEALRWAPVDRDLEALIIAGTRDPKVRVRAAAVARIGELQLAPASTALIERLREDPWPLVRAPAASALSQLGSDPSIDPALAGSLKDESANVRRSALFALGTRRASQHAGAVAERFQDSHENASVRAAAATALGEMCVQSAADELTQVALWLAQPGRPDPELGLARSALSALGRLSPRDLAQRLAPLSRAKVSPLLRPSIDAALQPLERCPNGT